MIVQVEQWAFGEGEIREVNVPMAIVTLDQVFHYGQNDFQNVPGRYSVSVGDIILLKGERWVIAPIGFTKLTEQAYQEYIKIPRRDRTLSTLLQG